MIVLFWLLMVLITWHFVGYGALLWLLTRGRRSPSVDMSGELPTVSIVITVHDEEAIIADRIANCLSLDYPRDRLEILVCSDASTDRTVEIARSFEGVKVIELETRHRARTQSLGVKSSTGDVVCFTDAETSYDPQCIRRMVERYADPKVGGVVGYLQFRSSQVSPLGGFFAAYWQWENCLRQWQSQLGVLFKLSGANMSMRASLYRLPPRGVDIDQSAGLELALQGYRTVAASEAIAYDVLSARAHSEWVIRRRLTVQALTSLLHYRRLLNPLRHPVRAFHLFSYSLLRYLMPLLFLGIFTTSATLSMFSPFFAAIAGVQVVFFVLALVGWATQGSERARGFLGWPYALCVFQAGLLAGLFEFAIGRRIDAYEPTRTPEEKE